MIKSDVLMALIISVKKSILIAILAAIMLVVTPDITVAKDTSTYRVYTFISDFHRYKIGDYAPDIYFTPQYQIKKWKIRNLPAPYAGAHWSYMFGTYVLLNESDHKIVLAYDSDIFYKKNP